jgi:hypothetical protein
MTLECYFCAEKGCCVAEHDEILWPLEGINVKEYLEILFGHLAENGHSRERANYVARTERQSKLFEYFSKRLDALFDRKFDNVRQRGKIKNGGSVQEI